MPRLKSDSGERLARAICAHIVNFMNFTPSIEAISSRDWASVTFSGARHEVILRLEGNSAAAAADLFLDGLAERDFSLRGHILADLALVCDERFDDGALVRLRVEALTVEET